MSVNMNNRSSAKSVRIGNHEPVLFYDEAIDTDSDSISGEEEVGSGSDSEQRIRVRPAQEIWETSTVWNALMLLDDANIILELINNQQLDQLTLYKSGKKTGILIASWLGQAAALKVLIAQGATVHVADCGGRILLDAGAPVIAWDSGHKATPIHCTASRGYLACTKLLIRRGADVNAGITNKSPLHYAVQSLAADCVKELLEAGAIPNTPQVYTEAPLHVAAALGSTEIIKLLIKHGAAVTVQCGLEKTTALHLVAEDDNVESARLLLDAGAHIMAVNKKLQTPLHLATLSQSTETLQLLLSRGANPNVTDINGRTPLHGAIAKASRCECIRFLLNAGANVNASDAFGYTPLHLAALNEYSQFVMMLINHGGDVTARTNGGISVLTFITRRTPDVIPKYITKFGSAIKLTDHELGDVDCELKLDFRVLVPSPNKGETELLLNFIEVGHREVLNHPLCETFLHLKWKRIRKFFFFSLFYHTLFVTLYTGYILGVFLKNCPSKRMAGESNCKIPMYITVVGFILIWFNFLFMAKEIFQIAHNWSGYVKNWENWLQWLIIISVFLCVFPNKHTDIRLNVHTWQHHVAAVGIFLTWVELMMIVGRFPIFGLYVQMFTTVSINFSKFLLTYSCLLIAFALSFGVLFPNYKSLQMIEWSALKTVIMMSGELEFEDMFYDPDYKLLYPITTHIMFFAFVLLVTLILSNLLVGLAVNDIQGLFQSAGLDRLVRQAQLVAHLESMLFSRLFKCAPKRLLKWFYNQALLLRSQHHCALYVRPNDPREERIPKYLIKNIYQLVVEQKEKLKIRSRISNRKRCHRHLYDMQFPPPVSRLNSNLSGLSSTEQLQLELLRKEFQEWGKVFLDKIEQLSKPTNTEER
ncbi:transient receptor potential channel pyrexia isoform X2 [Photinus pyralis]|uniref:transient receptor potential channel pyrexia isoform X2 n=1 Tax=Photinus pyralis TaxID=7054 RepID=UPI0012675577|nr:transient receptor potential channel pyrexia isoform X2 [Photinus pyralis]